LGSSFSGIFCFIHTEQQSLPLIMRQAFVNTVMLGFENARILKEQRDLTIQVNWKYIQKVYTFGER